MQEVSAALLALSSPAQPRLVVPSDDGPSRKDSPQKDTPPQKPKKDPFRWTGWAILIVLLPLIYSAARYASEHGLFMVP